MRPFPRPCSLLAAAVVSAVTLSVAAGPALAEGVDLPSAAVQWTVHRPATSLDPQIRTTPGATSSDRYPDNSVADTSTIDSPRCPFAPPEAASAVTDPNRPQPTVTGQDAAGLEVSITQQAPEAASAQKTEPAPITSVCSATSGGQACEKQSADLAASFELDLAWVKDLMRQVAELKKLGAELRGGLHAGIEADSSAEGNPDPASVDDSVAPPSSVTPPPGRDEVDEPLPLLPAPSAAKETDPSPALACPLTPPAKDPVQTSTPSSPAPAPAKTNPIKKTTVAKESNRQIGARLAAKQGWTGTQFKCLSALWTRESNWNHRATNRDSGAYGIPQALPGTKMLRSGADWKTNPETQIKWGLLYIKLRYGTPCAAWDFFKKKNWY